jgi:hypothetical protein
MTRNELLEIIVPGTIVQWTIETPQFAHSGKSEKLHNMYKSYSKKDLLNKYNYLSERGYIN